MWIRVWLFLTSDALKKLFCYYCGCSTKKMPRKFGDMKLFCVPLHRQKRKARFDSECSAVGSALRSGRRGRAFESPHSD